MAGEDLLEPVIVANRHEGRNVSGKDDSRESNSVSNETPYELSGDMLRISGAAAIAKKGNFASLSEAINNNSGNLHDSISPALGKGQMQLSSFFHRMCDLPANSVTRHSFNSFLEMTDS